LARRYRDRHALTVTEWRILAVLGRFRGLVAKLWRQSGKRAPDGATAPLPRQLSAPLLPPGAACGTIRRLPRPLLRRAANRRVTQPWWLGPCAKYAHAPQRFRGVPLNAKRVSATGAWRI